MERYTKKVKNSYCEYLPKDPDFLDLIGANRKNLEGTYDCELSCLVDKLGELEDLMEKYNIDSVEELDKLLQTLKDYIVKSQTYSCENDTYSVEQLSINIDEDDGEDFKIAQKILWGVKHEK